MSNQSLFEQFLAWVKSNEKTVTDESPKTLRETQQAAADTAGAGKGNPPPILPEHTFNPVLSQAGIPQVWYYDEPKGGWPVAAKKQLPGEEREYIHTNPTGGGYWADAHVDEPVKVIDISTYTDEQKMLAQYVMANGPTQVSIDLDKSLGGDGVNRNLRYLNLIALFAKEGDGRFYNSYAETIMRQLGEGVSVQRAKKNLASWAQVETSVGSKESIAQVDDAWFDLAAQVVAKYS